MRTSATTTIVDRYILGTRLRLRRVESGSDVVYKLGQKVRVDEGDPTTVQLTNLYLSEDEYLVLRELPAAELCKTRAPMSWGDRTVAVDRFSGRLEGLVLCEVELAPEERLLALPPWAAADVTHDDRFSGGGLAFASDDAVKALLGEAHDRTRSR